MHGHVTYSEFSLISFRKPSRAHRRVQHYVHTLPVFVLLGNIGLHLSARGSMRSAMCHIYDHSYMCAAFIHFGNTLVSPDLSGCTSRDHELSHSLLKHRFFENLESYQKCICGRIFDLLALAGAVVGLRHHKIIAVFGRRRLKSVCSPLALRRPLNSTQCCINFCALFIASFVCGYTYSRLPRVIRVVAQTENSFLASPTIYQVCPLLNVLRCFSCRQFPSAVTTSSYSMTRSAGCFLR